MGAPIQRVNQLFKTFVEQFNVQSREPCSPDDIDPDYITTASDFRVNMMLKIRYATEEVMETHFNSFCQEKNLPTTNDNDKKNAKRAFLMAIMMFEQRNLPNLKR